MRRIIPTNTQRITYTRFFMVPLALLPVAAMCDPAVYDVELQNSRVLITIDTHPWLVGNNARTALLHVVYKTTNGSEIRHDYDFLGGATTPPYLTQGHVYARSLPVNVAGVSSITDSKLEYAFDAKLDAPPEHATKRQVGAADVVVKGPVTMTLEPHINRNGSDYRRQGVSNAAECQALCKAEAQCRAFTTGTTGGMCWLKDGAPPPESCSNCVSGVKQD